MNNLGLVVLALLCSVYGLICAVECGIGLVFHNSKLSSTPKSKYQKLGANWQIINALVLVLVVITFILLSHSYLVISHIVKYLLIIAFVSLILKIISSFYLYRLKDNLKPNLAKPVYLLTNYLVPLSLGSIGIYLLTGQQFWKTIVGWSLFVSMIVGLSVIGLSSVNRDPAYLKTVKLRQSIDILFAGWAVVLGFVFPLSLQHYNAFLIGPSLSVLEIIIIVSVLAYSIVSIKQKKPYELYQYTFLIGLSAPFILAWNNRPYLLSLKVTLTQAFNLSSYINSYNWLGFIILIFATVVVLFGVYILGDFLNVWPKNRHANLPNN